MGSTRSESDRGDRPEKVNLLGRLTRGIVFPSPLDEGTPEGGKSRYRNMWRHTVLAVAAVSIIPLIVMTLVNYTLYKRSFNQEITQPINRITAITKSSVESFLEERLAAAKFILSRESFDDLYDQDNLQKIFKRMRSSFGGIVDVGIIDPEGVMRAYAGPYDLLGKTYADQDWFGKVLLRDVYVSEVFLGYRNIPHLVIAVKGEDDAGREAVFRATIDTELLNKQIRVAGLKQNSDAFIVSRSGVLQTQSRQFGPPLSRFPIAIPPFTGGTEIIENVEIRGARYFMGYAYIDRTPFLFVILADRRDLTGGWLTYQSEIFVFLALSTIAILALIMSITSNWVGKIRELDLKREATLHKIEHSNKMASIGRLAAGVAHEINNPLAIINEKAGLLHDIADRMEGGVLKEKILKQVDSILQSVKRCSDITHRLLGFARHMDIKMEPVAVDALIRDVLGFLEKEASYRGIHVNLLVPDALPTIHSDKGQLQQLFLNIINNAFDAMKKGGNLNILVEDHPPDEVVVTISDDGCGIPKQDLERIFEPFFTTKGSEGTGLGLSICYGIVQKLRGTMNVESEPGLGTSFRINLPKTRIA
jgi:signal transduction histidine kinase